MARRAGANNYAPGNNRAWLNRRKGTMDPLTFIAITQAATESLKLLKQTFFDDRKTEELKRKTQEHVNSLAEQVQLNKALLDELVTQFEAGKAAVEQHNEILLSLNQAAQAAAGEMQRLRNLAYVAIGVSGFSVVLLAAQWFK